MLDSSPIAAIGFSHEGISNLPKIGIANRAMYAIASRRTRKT